MNESAWLSCAVTSCTVVQCHESYLRPLSPTLRPVERKILAFEVFYSGGSYVLVSLTTRGPGAAPSTVHTPYSVRTIHSGNRATATP